MRLVDDGVAARRNDFSKRALPHRGVRAQQMVVHDHHVRLRRALPHSRDVAVAEAGALGADTVLARRRDVRPQRKVLGQVFHLRAIAGLGLPRPLVDRRDCDRLFARADRGAILQRVEAMQTEIVAASLHVSGRERNAEGFLEDRQVLEEDLFLEVLGAGRDEHPLAAEDRGHEVGERFPGSRPRFGEEHAAVSEHVRHGGGHLELRGARLEAVERDRQRAARREHRADFDLPAGPVRSGHRYASG